MREHYAFIDESGSYDFDFEKQGVSKYFIVTAILVEKNNLEDLKSEIEEMHLRYIQPDEEKSSEDCHSSQSILRSINSKKFHIYTLVVNKELLNQEGGLGYKNSFLKFLNGLLYRELYRTFPNLEMVAEEHDDKAFMTEFKQYVYKKHMPDLFNQSVFGFINSDNNVLVQLANFISETFLKKYENPDTAEDLLHIIRDKIIRVREWPNVSIGKSVELTEEEKKEYGSIIIEQSVNLASQFISNYEMSDEPIVRDQVNFTKFLLLNLNLNKLAYVSSNEIIKNLQVFKKEKVNLHHLRSNIVAPLRDKGLLIASSEKGYKLPISKADLVDYVNFSSLKIIPMLHRLERCRDQILLATKKELDIMDYPEYVQLKRYFDT